MTVRRREFITLLGGTAAAWPLAARAQQDGRTRRVGVLMNGVATDARRQTDFGGFVQELRQLGWTEGQNIRIDIRWNAGNADLARTYAAQLIGLSPDVILAASSTNLSVVQQATSSVPVVFVLVSDPVTQGFVASMIKPGGNITGFALPEVSVAGKWLGLLKKIAPGFSRVAVMFNPETSPQSRFFMPAIESAASALDVQAVTVPVRATADIEPALDRFARQPNGGLILPTDTFIRLRIKIIADVALRLSLPSISAQNEYVKQGGLMYYGPIDDQFRLAATYVDRILRGAKAGDLPVQNPDKYTLIINLKTAKALGLEVSQDMLSIADEVIE